MHVVPLPALADNYIWLLHDTRDAIAVDPGDAAVVERALASRKLQLRGILLTHHHPDHCGGVSELRTRHGVPVYAPDDPRVLGTTTVVRDGDIVQIDCPSASFQVLAVPGHTLSHIAYAGDGFLFCGDTLFSLGCGRLFEGDPSQMTASLDRLATLPSDTLVCAGHEYTSANGRFALTVDPRNDALRQRADHVSELLAQGLPTLPVTLASELATNPFLRIDSKAIIEWCAANNGPAADRVGRFALLRRAKDAFRR